jgi:hypothetical protein
VVSNYYLSKISRKLEIKDQVETKKESLVDNFVEFLKNKNLNTKKYL